MEKTHSNESYLQTVLRLWRKKAKYKVKPASTIKNNSSTVAKCSELAFFLLSIALLIFLIWRCQFGFAQKDECFYLTIPYRICQGDKLMIHEWHETQLSGLLLVPFMKALLFVLNGTEGIILAFRILYTVIWWLASVFCSAILSTFQFGEPCLRQSVFCCLHLLALLL